MLLRFYVEEAKDKISDLINYQEGAEEITTIIGDRVVEKLKDLECDLDYLLHLLDFQ